MDFLRKCIALFSGWILAAALVSAGLLDSAPSVSHAQNAAATTINSQPLLSLDFHFDHLLDNLPGS